MRTASWTSMAVTVVLSGVVAMWLMVRGGPDPIPEAAVLQAARSATPGCAPLMVPAG